VGVEPRQHTLAVGRMGGEDRQARAEAVRPYLVSKGVSKDRIEAIGYGAAKPKKTEAASRRVDVVVLND
jgi:outer membrane protein OmpA-like peptidoglycan-associated protein